MLHSFSDGAMPQPASAEGRNGQKAGEQSRTAKSQTKFATPVKECCVKINNGRVSRFRNVRRGPVRDGQLHFTF